MIEDIETIIITLIVLALPVAVILLVIRRIDKETVTPPSEFIEKQLRRGFFLSFWGIDIAISCMIPAFLGAIKSADYDDPWVVMSVAIGAVIYLMVGFIVLVIGRTMVGCQTRRINFIKGRTRTPLEEWVLMMMDGVESRQGDVLFNQVAVATDNKVDDIEAITNGAGVIFAFFKIGKVFTGNNLLKNHWPWIIAIGLTIIITVWM